MHAKEHEKKINNPILKSMKKIERRKEKGSPYFQIPKRIRHSSKKREIHDSKEYQKYLEL